MRMGKMMNHSIDSMKVLHLSLLGDFGKDNHHENDRNRIRVDMMIVDGNLKENHSVSNHYENDKNRIHIDLRMVHHNHKENCRMSDHDGTMMNEE